MNATGFMDFFTQNGYFIDRAVFPADLIQDLKAGLDRAIRAEAAYKTPESDHDPLQVMCCPFHDDIFLELLARDEIINRVEALLDRHCIVYTFTNSSMSPGQGNFSSRIHVDRHHMTGDYQEGVGLMVLLDDFTEQNGATWYLPGSQHQQEAPSEADFYARSLRLVAPAGTVFYFHPRLWHAGGENHTGTQRDAVLLGFSRAHVKQRLNLPKLLKGHSHRYNNQRVLQKLGFQAEPPQSLEEFYQASAQSYSLRMNRTD